MQLDEYQVQALTTNLVSRESDAAAIVPLLGLAGEVGELLAEYKKWLRDGDAHKLFESRIAEELGDIVWYVAAVASHFGLSLEQVAKGNLLKTAASWGGPTTQSVCGRFDSGYPDTERFPSALTVQFDELREGDLIKVRAMANGEQMGQTLTDNAHGDDGYRFHDVFHLACVAGLGWSPVSRRNLKLKRRSNPRVDEVEDGGRAIVIEEGVTALLFSYAIEHDWLRGVTRIDHDVLKKVKKMTAHLEVSECSIAEWERTIIMAYRVWDAVVRQRGGAVVLDLSRREIANA
jgi:NTP pyrophosphatase (non-canonical NTP hydrolase)